MKIAVIRFGKAKLTISNLWYVGAQLQTYSEVKRTMASRIAWLKLF